MKGTLISIFVGALAGVLLTVCSNVHAAHVAASRAKHGSSDITAPMQTPPNTVSRAPVAPARPAEQAPLPK